MPKASTGQRKFTDRFLKRSRAPGTASPMTFATPKFADFACASWEAVSEHSSCLLDLAVAQIRLGGRLAPTLL